MKFLKQSNGKLFGLNKIGRNGSAFPSNYWEKEGELRKFQII